MVHSLPNSIAYRSLWKTLSFFIALSLAPTAFAQDDGTDVGGYGNYNQSGQATTEYEQFEGEFNDIFYGDPDADPSLIGPRLSALLTQYRSTLLEVIDNPDAKRMGADGVYKNDEWLTRVYHLIQDKVSPLGLQTRNETLHRVEVVKQLRSHFPDEFAEVMDKSYSIDHKCRNRNRRRYGLKKAEEIHPSEVCPAISQRTLLLRKLEGLDEDVKKAILEVATVAGTNGRRTVTKNDTTYGA
jgi:hypothetical protein